MTAPPGAPARPPSPKDAAPGGALATAQATAVRPLPVVAIIGRPNVGKSTLFNRLTRSRDALVHDLPGLTRDRQYGIGRVGDVPFIVVDTGGFEPESKSGISSAMARQTRQAVVEADHILFVADGRAGLTPHDEDIANEMRRHADKVTLVVNKTEGMSAARVSAEFYELGMGEPQAISSAHGDGVNSLVEEVLAQYAKSAEPDPPDGEVQDDPSGSQKTGEKKNRRPQEGGARRVSIAVIGRPNAGKSTLINTLLGEERMVAFDQPGTTRDSVAVDFDRGERQYTLIDTAGVRRRARVSEAVEKFSVIKTLQAIEASNVCILLLDATQGISDQDAHLAGHILESGRALVVAVNKWDVADASEKDWLKQEVDRKFHFLAFARYHYISALKGSGIGAMLRSADDAYAAATRDLSTPKLTRSMQLALERQQPPRRLGIRPKLRYAHQGGRNPPVVVIHGSALDKVPATYIRYLEGWFRDEFKLQGTPLRVEMRSGTNPYARSTGKAGKRR